jgi:hypothetical protein
MMSNSNESQGIETSSAKKKATKIDHTYHDYSTEDIDKNKKVTAGESSFPVKLHCMLSDAMNSGIIHWMPHGRAWIVVDKTELGRICENHFGHGRFVSCLIQSDCAMCVVHLHRLTSFHISHK